MDSYFKRPFSSTESHMPGGERVFDLRLDPGEDRPLLHDSGEPAQGWQTLEHQRARAFCVTEDGTDARLRALGYID